jgi:hypothetical protein
VERWRGFFKPEREAAEKAAVEVGGRLPVEDRLPYMLGWVDSDVAIIRNKKGERVLRMTTSHLWQLAETHALFGWSVVGLRMNLTLEGPKLVVDVEAPLERLDEVIMRSVEGGWLNMLGSKAGLEDLMHVKSWDDLKRWIAKNWDVVVDAAVRRLGEEVRNELSALRDKLNDDKVAREVVAPALLLIQAEKLGVNEETLKYFGTVVSGAIGGDGYVSAAMKRVELASGEREIALLWAAAFAAYSIKAEVRDAGSASRVIVSGGDAARLAGLYFLFGPPLLEGDEKVINHKLADAVELGAEGLNVSWEGLRRTEGGLVAANLIISEAGITVKYNVYLLKDAILLQFESSNRSRVELAARLLKLAGVGAEVRKEDSRDVWYVVATTDRLAAGREELRSAIAEVVKKAVEKRWVEAGMAERWLDKLERGRVLKEGWPKYEVGLAKGALRVRFASTSLDSIQREAQRLENMGLKWGVHFTVKMPEGGKKGYVSILKEGLERAAWLSVHGKDEQQRKLAADFVEYILQRAKEACGGAEQCAVYEKVREIIEEGRARGSVTLKGFEKEVEVNGEKYKVKVIGGSAEFDVGRSGKKLLRIRITAEVGGVRSEYEVTYSRHGADNATMGYAYARADASGGREEDAKRFAALIKALTGVEPRIRRRSDDKIEIVCGREHLDGFKHFAELADAIEKWLEETSHR